MIYSWQGQIDVDVDDKDHRDRDGGIRVGQTHPAGLKI